MKSEEEPCLDYFRIDDLTEKQAEDIILPEYLLRVGNEDQDVVTDFMNDMMTSKHIKKNPKSRAQSACERSEECRSPSLHTVDVVDEDCAFSALMYELYSSQKLVLLAALVALATADTAPLYGHPAPPPVRVAPAKYDFNYAVKDEYSGNDFGHQEARDGYDTQGSYYVLLPDGRLQKVAYTVIGDAGFVADVTYEGEAKYPEYKPAPPAYA
ncbi:uncharacterized protein LOC143036216 [Oratosquilla oratoria]|uniref:uncharacterized protein LOC143036216 n=1 Tax=Oratosquilla oratoria TaxID=337810 RepID=UPI003F76B525